MRGGFLQALTLAVEVLEGFHEGLGHPFMCFGGATDHGKLLGLREALMAIAVVEADPEKGGT